MTYRRTADGLESWVLIGSRDGGFGPRVPVPPAGPLSSDRSAEGLWHLPRPEIQGAAGAEPMEGPGGSGAGAGLASPCRSNHMPPSASSGQIHWLGVSP